MNATLSWALWLSASVWVTAAGTLSLPAQPPTSRAARIARDVRAGDVRASVALGEAVGILTQRDRSYPESELDAVADSLVVIALMFPGDSAKAVNTRGRAMAAIMRAGTALNSGTPYKGAASRLRRIALGGRGVGASAVFGLTRLPDRSEALRELATVARSNVRTARVAVEFLATDMDDAGVQVLKELHDASEVTEPSAQKQLLRIARDKGWRTTT